MSVWRIHVHGQSVDASCCSPTPCASLVGCAQYLFLGRITRCDQGDPGDCLSLTTWNHVDYAISGYCCFPFRGNWCRPKEWFQEWVVKECVPKECVPKECAPKECAPKEYVPKECVAKECVAKECFRRVWRTFVPRCKFESKRMLRSTESSTQNVTRGFVEVWRLDCARECFNVVVECEWWHPGFSFDTLAKTSSRATETLWNVIVTICVWLPRFKCDLFVVPWELFPRVPDRKRELCFDIPNSGSEKGIWFGDA